MIRKVLTTLAVAAAVVLAPQNSSAQEGFTTTYTDIGATIGLGGIGDASFAFGGRFEKAIKTLPDLGDGILGIQASFDYYHWDEHFSGVGFNYDWDYTYMPIGVTANYHFDLENNKIDPFLGAGLGYSIVSCDLSGTFNGDCGYNSAIYFIGRAGIRYFLQRLALYADVGAGAATLNLGAMFKIN